MSSGKLLYLDVIRGLAALVVVICHIHAGFRPVEPAFFSGIIGYIINPKYTFIFGEVAVYIFFVLSGIVLSLSYFSTQDKRIIKTMLIKRYPRLFIPVFVTSLLYWICLDLNWFHKTEVVAINNSKWMIRFWNTPYSFADFFAHITYPFFIFTDGQFCKNVNSSLWTIPVEIQYSYLLILTLFLLKNLKNIIWMNVIILLNLLVFENENIFAFGLGLNIAYFYTSYTITLSNKESLLLMIFAWVLATNLFGTYWGVEKFYCVSGALILVSIMFNQKWRTWLSKPSLIFLGKISFSLYLIHLLVIGTLSSFLYSTMITKWQASQEFTYTVVFFVTLISSVLAAILIYYLVEKPSLLIAARISNLVLK